MTAVHAIARMPIARVLVVDDSVVARRVVARAIDADPSLELAGVAANGKAALEKLDLLHPDIVVLDLDMPVMNGFETLTEMRRTHPRLPVIVFSHLTHAGAAATFDALALGATGFALKPRADGIGLAEDLVRAELLPLIKAVAPATRDRDVALRQAAHSAGPEGPAAGARAVAPGARAVAAVVIAVSTGGPNALAEIVPSLPRDMAVPIFVVQHMPPLFTKMLADRLDRLAGVDVVEASDGEPVVPGRLYIAPGGRHMTVARAGARVEIALEDGPPENSCRPAADVLFRSAARIYGSGLLGVVLTGMGSDGLRGCETIRASGGAVIAQSSESSVVSSMPAAIADAGLANAVVSLDQIGPELVRRIESIGS